MEFVIQWTGLVTDQPMSFQVGAQDIARDTEQFCSLYLIVAGVVEGVLDDQFFQLYGRVAGRIEEAMTDPRSRSGQPVLWTAS